MNRVAHTFILVGATVMATLVAFSFIARSGTAAPGAESKVFLPMISGKSDEPTATPTPSTTPSSTPTATATATASPQPKELPGEIAFTSWRSGDPYVYIMGADGSSPSLVKQYGEAQYDPAWSPDNEKIAFSALTGEQPCPNPQYTCAVWDIIVMNRDGTQVNNLTEPLDTNSNRYPVWSPDGLEIAFHSANQPFCSYPYILKTSDPTELEWTDAYGYLHDWSPDGKSLLMTVYEDKSFPGLCDEMDQGLYEYDIEAMTSKRIYAGSVFSASWAPGGNEIAFSTDSDIYLMQADGSDLRKIAAENGFVSSLSWSPDAQWIAFASDENETADIYIISRDGSERRQITSNPNADSSPDWSN